MQKDNNEEIENYKETLGHNIKFIRESVMAYTQTEFVKRIGLSQGFISDVEKGKKIPGGEFFIAMLHFMNVNLNYLVTGDGNIFRDNPKDQITSIGDRIRLIRLENKLTEREFSDGLDITVTRLVSIERNMLEPEQDLLITIAHKYEEDINWLIKGETRPTKGLFKSQSNYDIFKEELKLFKDKIGVLESQVSTQKNIIQSQRETIATQRELIAMLKKHLSK